MGGTAYFCQTAIAGSYANGDMDMSISASGMDAGAYFSAEGYYTVEAIGSGSGPVSLDLTASGTTSVTGPDAVADASIQIYNLTGNASSCVEDVVGFCSAPYPATFIFNASSFTLQPNTPYTVFENLRVVPVEGSGFASIDPMISFDPTWLANNPGFSLVFSPNVIAPAAVPEPFTLSIFGAGLVGAVAMRRRRKAKA